MKLLGLAAALNPHLLRHMMQRMARQGRGDDGLARFGEPGVLVLLSLSDGPKHGYAITSDVFEQTGVRLGPGTTSGHTHGAALEPPKTRPARQSEAATATSTPPTRRPQQLTNESEG